MRKSMVMGAVFMMAACSKGGETEQAPVAKATSAPTENAAAMATPKAEAKAEVTVTTKSPEALAAFQKGRDLIENQRGNEAVEPLQKAIALDAEFALAHAYLAFVTPGTEGQKLAEKAVALAASLPEAEKLTIQADLDARNGNDTAMADKLKKVAELAPGDWRTLNQLGGRAQQERRFDDALQWFEKVRTLKPDLALAYNGLAYANANLSKWDDAIAAAKKQAELLPGEANPQDTLGEVLMWSGKFDESEQAFQQAAKANPKFDIAWQGVAFARAFQGNWAGAYEATAKQRAAASQPQDRLGADIDLAWLKFSEGKLPEAMATLDKVEKDADAKKLPVFAFVPVNRANMLYLSGKYAEAQKALVVAKTRAAQLPPGPQESLNRGQAAFTVSMAAVTGKGAADAEKAFTVLEAATKASPDDKTLAAMVAAQHGMLVWAKGDPKAAAAEMWTCDADNFICRFDLALAQEKSGDKAAAAVTRKALASTPRRDHATLWAHQHWMK